MCHVEIWPNNQSNITITITVIYCYIQYRLAIGGGVILVLSGLCAGIAAGMWAYRLVTDFNGFMRYDSFIQYSL